MYNSLLNLDLNHYILSGPQNVIVREGTAGRQTKTHHQFVVLVLPQENQVQSPMNSVDYLAPI